MTKHIATPGADGAKVESLLSKVRTKGSEAIYKLAEDIAHEGIKNRSLSDSTRRVLALSDEIAKATSTAHMLGRAKIRNRFNKFTSFSEASDFAFFNEGEAIHPMSPRSALAYWNRIVPMRQTDPGAFEATQEGNAFNVAATTNQNLLKKIWDVIAEAMRTGHVKQGPKSVERVLETAGIHPKKGYGDLVFDTNLMEAYRKGAWNEYQDPAIADMFPVWQYLGIVDGRQREKHHKLSNLFFPRDVDFFDVRGRGARDICRCRCDMAPVSSREWQRLLKQGKALSGMDDVRRIAA